MKHLNEATIQALLDGELSDDATARATEHLALCGRCANALLEAEAEQTEVNIAFAAESGMACPSQRIWARIENEIDFLGAPNRNQSKPATKSFWQHFAPPFGAPAQAAAFASGLAVAVVAAFFAVQVLRQAELNPSQPVAKNDKPNISDSKPSDNPVIVPSPGKETLPNETFKPRFAKAGYSPKNGRLTGQNRTFSIRKPKLLVVLPEEQNYLNSIAELSKAVKTSDEFVMRPAFRVEYERNLAVMDGAISAMQKQVRRNPKDENAKRILFASYQNKIELLNTVAEKSQMIASLR